jgi:hypothetical protein
LVAEERFMPDSYEEAAKVATSAKLGWKVTEKPESTTQINSADLKEIMPDALPLAVDATSTVGELVSLRPANADDVGSAAKVVVVVNNKVVGESG